MGLADIVRNGVALADKLTLSLQVNVTHRPWTGQGVDAAPTWASPGVSVPAIVIEKRSLVRFADGHEKMSSHYVGILRPLTPNGATGRDEPVDPRDLIILPDGTTASVLSVAGVVDNSTGKRFYCEVLVG